MVLLTSTLITPGAKLWTLDKRLEKLAEGFGVAHRVAVHCMGIRRAPKPAQAEALIRRAPKPAQAEALIRRASAFRRCG